MRPKIYRYQHNEKRYYAEGYDEANVRLTLENYLQIVPGSLKPGAKPDFNTELKLIWDKRNTTHVLSLKKEQTTSRAQLQTFRKKQHCVYELRLLLKEDKTFLNGHQGHVIANEDNEVKFLNCKYIKDDGTEIGDTVCYSFQGSTDPDMTSRIYRFKSLATAYKYVRNELFKYDIQDEAFNKNITNLEVCDSFISGFGNADLYLDNNNIMVKIPAKNYNNKEFNIR